jgi:hypothetical protein
VTHSEREKQDSPGIADLRRRRAWFIWVAAVGLAGFAASGYLGSRYFPEGSGDGAEAGGVVIVLFLAAGIAGLLGVAAFTLRLYLRGAYPRTSRSGTAGGASYPGQQKLFVTLFAVFYLAAVFFSVFVLPVQVNSVASLADQGPRATFIPRSVQQSCGARGCTSDTAGILEPGGARATWPGQVPVGQPFTVALPVWKFGIGNGQLAGSELNAIVFTLLPMILQGITAWFSVVFISRIPALRRRTAA